MVAGPETIEAGSTTHWMLSPRRLRSSRPIMVITCVDPIGAINRTPAAFGTLEEIVEPLLEYILG